MAATSVHERRVHERGGGCRSGLQARGEDAEHSTHNFYRSKWVAPHTTYFLQVPAFPPEVIPPGSQRDVHTSLARRHPPPSA